MSGIIQIVTPFQALLAIHGASHPAIAAPPAPLPATITAGAASTAAAGRMLDRGPSGRPGTAR